MNVSSFQKRQVVLPMYVAVSTVWLCESDINWLTMKVSELSSYCLYVSEEFCYPFFILTQG